MSALDIVDEINKKLRAAGAVAHLLCMDPDLDEPITAAASHIQDLIDDTQEFLEKLQLFAVKRQAGTVTPLRNAAPADAEPEHAQ